MAEAGEPEGRHATHGEFDKTAENILRLEQAFYVGAGPTPLNAAQRHGVNQILVKLARISSGDPNCKDHWDDIAGYASLVAKGLK